MIFERIFKNSSIALIIGLLFYGALFIYRYHQFPYFISSSYFAFNNDAFYWSWCAKELVENGYVDFDNPALISEGRNPYFQGCFFSPGYTAIAYLTFKMFGINLRLLQIIIFIVMLINLILFFRILLKWTNDPFITSFVFFLFVMNPYITSFSFAIRPDPFALTFILLSILRTLEKKPLNSSLFFIIGAFIFKQNYLALVGLPVYFLIKKASSWEEKIKLTIKFLIPLFITALLYYFIVYSYLQTAFPDMLQYLSKSNTIPLLKALKADKFKLAFNLPLIIGLFSCTGMVYLMGLFATFIFNFRIIPPLAKRSFNPIFLHFGLAELALRFKFFRKSLPFLTILYLPVSFAFLQADFKYTDLETKLSMKIINYANEGKKICSTNAPSGGYLLSFYTHEGNLKKNLTFKFIYKITPNNLKLLSDCEVVILNQSETLPNLSPALINKIVITFPSPNFIIRNIIRSRLKNLLFPSLYNFQSRN